MNDSRGRAWTSEDEAKLFKLIGQNCQHVLTRLELHLSVLSNERFSWEEHYLQYPRPIQLQIMLGGLSNLRELIISEECKIIGDEELFVIGFTCEELSTLSVRNQPICDEGINNLCAIAAPYGRCKKIENLDLRGTQVTVKGLVSALSNLPRLALLEHPDTITALEMFVATNGESKKLKLQKILIFAGTIPATLDRICKSLPHVTSILLISIISQI